MSQWRIIAIVIREIIHSIYTKNTNQNNNEINIQKNIMNFKTDKLKPRGNTYLSI